MLPVLSNCSYVCLCIYKNSFCVGLFLLSVNFIKSKVETELKNRRFISNEPSYSHKVSEQMYFHQISVKFLNLSCSAGSVVLKSPVLPVTKGDDVMLSCRKRENSSSITADFYKDGRLIRSSSTGEMIINSVSKSDEGVYKCNISGTGESPESWLAVRGETLHFVNKEVQLVQLEYFFCLLFCSVRRAQPFFFFPTVTLTIACLKGKHQPIRFHFGPRAMLQ